MSLAVAASEVLGQFSPEFVRARLIPLGNRGGFSGASLWRVETESGHFCLKAWPLSGPTPERLGAIHVLLQQARRAVRLFEASGHMGPAAPAKADVSACHP